MDEKQDHKPDESNKDELSDEHADNSRSVFPIGKHYEHEDVEELYGHAWAIDGEHQSAMRVN